jgi:hypothetical protein
MTAQVAYLAFWLVVGRSDRAVQPARAGSGAITLRGSCARCGHVMEYLIGNVIRESRWRPASRREPAPAAAQETEHMVCTCEGEHPNQPEGFRGCGAYWDLAVPAR